MSNIALGFVGLGNIGAPMAERLTGWPGGLTVFDTRAEPMEQLVAAGATAADGVAGLAHADAISIMVRDDRQVRQVVAELAEYPKQGRVIAIHSTISPHTATELADRYRPEGIHIVDAPVTGGATAATHGELAVMVGADDDTFVRFRPVLAAFGSLIVHTGGPGSGTRMKLARNMLAYTVLAAAGEAMKLAEASGLDLLQLGEVVRHSDAYTGGPGATMIRESTTPLPADHDLYDIFTHTCTLGEKDLAFALALARETGLEMPFAELARTQLADALSVPHARPGADPVEK